jgi:hypothetical protein
VIRIPDYINYGRSVLARLIMPNAPEKPLDSTAYWKSRYANGGNSGLGSFGQVANHKASVVSEILATYDVQSVVDLGCGDGNQLNLLNLNYINYMGYDVSSSLMAKLQENFKQFENLRFSSDFTEVLGFNSTIERPSLVLSLDVIYHLVQDSVYYDYLEKIGILSPDLILIYSSNFDEGTDKYHVRHRKFTRDFPNLFPAYSMLGLIHGLSHSDTSADFFLFGRGSFSSGSTLIS